MPKLTAQPSKPQPTVNLTEDELPAIKTWKVGGKYSINLDVEMVRLSKGDIFMPESSRKMEATFKILGSGSSDHEGMMKDKKMHEPDKEMKMEMMKKKMGEYSKS